MILNFEIDDETGAMLDALAKDAERSRRFTATKILRDAVRMLYTDRLETEAEEEAA